MECIERGSDNFLCALAEAALAAKIEDYVVIRPVLLALKKTSGSGSRRPVACQVRAVQDTRKKT